MYKFEIPAPLYFGEDSRLKILPVLKQAGLSRLGVVIDENLLAQEVFTRFIQSDVPAAGLTVVRLLKTRGAAEPNYDYLDACVEDLRGHDFDALLGIGGGSAMDVAKGAAVVLTNGGKGIAYRGMDLVAKPGLPVVLFPTTAGTGAEVTRTASFTDSAAGKKLGINGRHVAAWAGVLDPAFSAACPASPTLSAGLDALVHCVESFTATTASPFARDAAKSAFPRLFNNLAKVIEYPDDLEARAEMALGSAWAGVAVWNAAGGGPASGISYPLGVHHGVPHGFAGGLLLPWVIRFNVSQGYRGYEPLFDLIAGAGSPSDKSRAFAQAFDALYERVKAPKTLARWGVGRESVDFLVKDTLTNRAANLTHNPVPFREVDVRALLTDLAGEESAVAARN